MPHSTSTLRNWTGYDTTYGILLLSLSTGLWISIPSMGRLFKTKKKKKKRRKEGTRKGILYRCCSHHVLILIMYFLWRWRGVIWCRWCVFSLECPHTSHYLLLRCSLALEKARRHEDCFLLLPLLLSGDGVESIRKKNSNHFVTDCLSCIIRTGWSSHWCVFFCMHWKHSACLCFFNWHVFVFVSFFFFFERTNENQRSEHWTLWALWAPLLLLLLIGIWIKNERKTPKAASAIEKGKKVMRCKQAGLQFNISSSKY